MGAHLPGTFWLLNIIMCSCIISKILIYIIGEQKRAIVERFGAELKLSNRTIQFTSVKYLVPIAEKYPELKEQFELARTDSEQMKKGLKEGLISQWYTGRD